MQNCLLFGFILVCCFSTAICLGGESQKKAAISGQNKKNKGLLCSRMDAASLEAKLIPAGSWRPFPPASDREAWEKIKAGDFGKARNEYAVSKAEKLLDSPWPLLTAKGYYDFIRDGNRRRYEAPYFERRNRMQSLVIAECLEHKGRFTDEIVNGMVLILEESTWIIPAHTKRNGNDPFHREDMPYVDLFAGETAVHMAEWLYMLEEELTDFSPSLVQRIKTEIEKRVIVAVEQNLESMWWKRGSNNWTPWCSSNILLAAAYTLNDNHRLAKLAAELLNPCIDRYYDNFPDDGCCDEGPRYWTLSPARFYIYLHTLQELTNGAFDFFHEKKVKLMGEYIANAQLSGPWSVNFADAEPRAVNGVNAAILYNYGKSVSSIPMQQLALRLVRGYDDKKINGFPAKALSGNNLRSYFWLDAAKALQENPVTIKDKTVWYPLTQVLIARESENPDQGLIMAIKGGHNNENHNHNDVGQFIIMKDGKPMIVDPGVGRYTRDYFSDKRYTYWNARTSGHNAPVINDVEQAPGESFRATKVKATLEGAKNSLSLELSKAYPEKAGIESYLRTATLSTDKIIINDKVETGPDRVSVSIRLFTPAQVKKEADCLILEYEGATAILRLQGADFSAVEDFPLDDDAFQNHWGGTLNSIMIQANIPEGEGQILLSVE